MNIGRYTVVKDFLSLSDVSVHYEGRLGSRVSTSSVVIKGKWHMLNTQFKLA